VHPPPWWALISLTGNTQDHDMPEPIHPKLKEPRRQHSLARALTIAIEVLRRCLKHERRHNSQTRVAAVNVA
jgi:hypothetical protein